MQTNNAIHTASVASRACTKLVTQTHMVHKQSLAHLHVHVFVLQWTSGNGGTAKCWCIGKAGSLRVAQMEGRRWRLEELALEFGSLVDGVQVKKLHILA
jgi:hypothetical protein